MRGLDVHESINVSDTKLMLGLRVYFISSDFTANKLFPINPGAIMGLPKMSLLLKVKSTSAKIIEPRLILVKYTDEFDSLMFTVLSMPIKLFIELCLDFGTWCGPLPKAEPRPTRTVSENDRVLNSIISEL